MNSKALIGVGAVLALIFGTLMAVGTTSVALFALFVLGTIAGFGVLAKGLKLAAAEREAVEAAKRADYLKRNSGG